jgi:hypothetical protein
MQYDIAIFVYTACLLTLCITERVIHAILVLYSQRHSIAKGIEAKQILADEIGLFSNIFAHFLSIVIRLAVFLLSWWILIFLLTFVFAMMFLLYNESPSFFVAMVDFYNVYIGPWCSQIIFVPLYILSLILRAFIPIWNAFFYFINVWTLQGLFPLLLAQINNLIIIAKSLAYMCRDLVLTWISGVEVLQCSGAECFVPGKMALNVITPMGYVKEIVANSVQVFRSACSLYSVPFDVLMYPFLDVNLAYFFHNFINSLYNLLLVVPVQTAARCQLASDNTFHIMMCTPDFTPVFDFMAASFASLGILVDNWLNIILVIIQQALTGTAVPCDQISDTIISDIMKSDVLFSNRNISRVLVVGLTHWMYALTDGQFIMYKGHSDVATKIGTWPWPANPAYGFAAVNLNDLHGVDASVVNDGATFTAIQTTSILGCMCTDTVDLGATITCSIAPMDGWTSDEKNSLQLQVIFPDQNIGKTMRCDDIDVLVKTVRFSFMRYSSDDVTFGSSTTTLPGMDCINRQNCREADASVWVVPRCGQSTSIFITQACVPGSSCFPYCMGLRLSGSQNNNILLSSASQWKQGRTVLYRDCNLYKSSPYSVSYDNTQSLSQSFVKGQGTILGSNLSVSIFAGPATATVNTPECYPMSNVISRVASSTYSSSVYNTYSSSQPFVITGDVLLTAKDIGGAIKSVVIDRLESNQKNEFTMKTLNQDFPAEPPLNVPADEFKYTSDEKVLIPYSTRISASVAVSSRNYVFYASNPDYGVYSAYFDYCTRDPAKMPKFGLIITSSYGPLRIYRVKAYAKCSAYSCGASLVRSIDLDAFKTQYDRQCDQHLNVSILQLEYLNEDNIAVVVLSSAIRDYDSENIKFTSNDTVVYWLNPGTMQLSTTIWQTTVSSSTIGTLCPGQQRLPRLGSFGAEMATAGLYFLQYFINIPLFIPGLIPIWQSGGLCPQNAYGHSMLVSCGANVLSLENFFDSVADATSIFWHSLNTISYAIQIQNTPAVNPLVDILNGMAFYGEGSIDLWTVRKSVLTLLKVPIRAQVQELWASVQTGSIVNSMKSFTTNTIIWIRYVYKVVSSLAMIIIQNALQGNTVTTSEIWQDIWNTIYDLRDYYAATVVNSNTLTCNGINMMLGIDNPWAKLTYYYCMAQTKFIDSVIDSLMYITVYVPMTVCVCENSYGLNVMQHVVDECSGKLPLQLRPQLYIMGAYVQERDTYITGQSLCKTTLEYTRQKIIHSMDPYFTNMNLGLTSLADVVDYLLIFFDAGAGKCLDFKGNPQVVSIVPQPVDYFQSCGKTTNCKMKCAAEWELFQQYNTTPVAMPSLDVQYESMFFPGSYDSTKAISNASAILELPAAAVNAEGNRICLSRTGPDDYVLYIAEVFGKSVQIRSWCIPQSAASTVYNGVDPGFPSVSNLLPGDVMQAFFISQHLLCLLLRVDTRNNVYFLHDTDGFYAATPVPLQSYKALINVVNIWPLLDTVFVDVLMREVPASVSQYVPVSYMDHYYLNLKMNVWVSVDGPDLTAFSKNYMITRLANSAGYHYMIMPKLSFLPAYLLSIEYNGIVGSTVKPELTMLSAFDANSVLPTVPTCVMSQQAISSDYVFVVIPSGWDWLRQIRLQLVNVIDRTVQVSSIHRSVAIDMTFTPQGNCDERSCEGCKSIFVQRLCQSYNKCALVRCVGTLVNQMRPLCAIGQTLSFKGSESLQMMHSGWLVVAEMLTIILKLTYVPEKGVDIAFPDDIFMGFICNSKDFAVEFWTILTSYVNAILHLSVSQPTQSFRSTRKINRDVDAALTIRATSFNSLLAQLTFMPLYGLIALKQRWTCQANGALALFDATGYRVRIESPGLTASTDVVAGACLLLSTDISMQSLFFAGEASGVVAKAADFLDNLQVFASTQYIDFFIHELDAFFTYVIGIIHSFSIMLMAFYPDKCNPPDYFISDVVQCACNDYSLKIPDVRANEGINEYGLWCSGTLGMLDSNNEHIVIVNPYSYAVLQEKVGNLDDYVACASVSYTCANEPFDEVFTRQGVTLLNVFVKCRENFLKKQWDPYAYVYFDRRAQSLIQAYGGLVPIPPGPVKDCLVASYDNSAGPDACAKNHILTLGYNSEDEYWTYERFDTTASENIDACLVFSGPALVQNISVFAACMDQTDAISSEDCYLNSQVWDVSSENDVPVAETHIVKYSGNEHSDLVLSYYEQAQSLVMNAIQDAIFQWQNESNPSVQMDFFSTEGDAIHQIMDCIYMGPYAKVDYWPFPAVLGDTENIKAPQWFRSEQSQDTYTRGIDINTCTSSSTMPFTCGSEARRSVIKYFVKTVLSSGRVSGNNNATLMQKVVLNELYHLRDMWGNKSNYACACFSNGLVVGHSMHCCVQDNSSGWLPDHLREEFQEIRSDSVLDALEDEYEAMYNFSLQNPLPWIQYNNDWKNGYYNWSQSKQVLEEAYLDPREPATSYDNVLHMNEGGAGLWGICHAALKQVFFTIPVAADNNILGLENTELYNGDPSTLENSIQQIAKKALRDSPTYRHYYARYHPSDSLLCNNTSVDSSVTVDGYSQYNSFTQGSPAITLLNSNEILRTESHIPTWHYKFMALGNKTCTCGWALLPSGYCVIPTFGDTCREFCQIYDFCVNTCQYHMSHDDYVEATLNKNLFACPLYDFSPHWGVLSSAESELWLQNQKNFGISSRELLKYGRSGIRLGNIDDINTNSYDYVNAEQRTVPLEHGRLYQCDYNSRLKNVPEMNATQLAEELFPMVHGVEESGVASYCLRYFIEKARYTVLQIIYNESTNTTVLDEDIALQRNLMTAWGRKCGTQLYLLHLCVSLNVFNMAIPDNGHQQKCAWFMVENRPNFYTTPECLVYLDGEFYDPCRCLPCVADTAGLPEVLILDATMLKSTAQCKLRFNPLDKAVHVNAPIGIWEDETPITDYLDFLNWTLLDMLLNDTDAVGNVPGGDNEQSWMHSEGFMHDNTAEFCDMMIDYWPDEADYPVGYHVSTTCDADDTAFRSFMNVFSREDDRDTNGNVYTTFKYQNDLLRNITDIDLLYGVNGLCRQNNFGMNMIHLNTMVFCTKKAYNERVDPTVFQYNSYSNQPNVQYEDTEYCTTDSSELPWDTFDDVTVYTSTRVTVGTVPNMPSSTANTYPENTLLTSFFDIASEKIVSNGLSSMCSLQELQYCNSSSACPSQYNCRGKRCSETEEYISCTSDSDCTGSTGTCQGVCVHQQIECIKHSDCVNPDHMCTGVGKCVQPEIIVQNEHDYYSMSLQFQVANNSDLTKLGNTYSLHGGSYWGYMGSDVLNLHGMCSYVNWYYYSAFYTKQCIPGISTSDTCWLDPSKTVFRDDATLSTNGSTMWWGSNNPRKPHVLHMRPSNCDRDYERLEGFTFYQPKLQDITMIQAGQAVEMEINDTLLYDNFTRAYASPTQSYVPIAILDNTDHAERFLFGPMLDGYIGSVDSNPMQACGNVRQCLKSPFTANFTDATRKIRDKSWIEYNIEDTFICGVIGYLNDQRLCVIDNGVFPLYDFFCTGKYDYSMCQGNDFLIETLRNDICVQIKNPYIPEYGTIKSNTDLLVQMFYMFDTSVRSYTDVMFITDCANGIYKHIKTNNFYTNTLYYPFYFVLKEIPYDYFYQCILLSSGYVIKPDITADQTCTAYVQKELYMFPGPAKQNNELLQNYLRFVRGGMSMSAYIAYTQSMQNLGIGILRNISQTLIDMYPTKQDQSVPICSKYRRWKTDLNKEKDNMIYNMFSSSSCQDNRFAQIFDILNYNMKYLDNYLLLTKTNSLEVGYLTLYWTTIWTYAFDVQEILFLLESINTYVTLGNKFALTEAYTQDSWALLTSEVYIGDTSTTSWQTLQSAVATDTMIDTVINNIVSQWGVTQVSNTFSLQYQFGIADITGDATEQYKSSADFPKGLQVEESQIKEFILNPSPPLVPERCAFKQQDDPFITPNTVCTLSSDKLTRTCGGESEKCVTIPLYSHKGLFYCHYHYLDFDINTDVTDAYSVFVFLYKYLRDRFVLAIRDKTRLFEISELDFFKDTDSQLNWRLNFSNELYYITNNQPDTTKTVMCTITTTQSIDYNKCNHPHWKKLKAHVEQFYYHKGAIIVRSGTQLQWKVVRDMFTSGFISSYSSSNKTDDRLEEYIKQLFDEERVCKMSYAGAANEYREKVCYKFINASQYENIGVVNPWLHGYYNPFARCDVSYSGVTPDSTEYIDTYVYDASGNLVVPPNMPLGQSCFDKRNQRVQYPGPSRFSLNPAKVDGSFPYNLCHHEISDEQDCYHDQGLLGNDDGLPIGTSDTYFNMFYNTKYIDEYNAYKPAEDMYDTTTWKIPDDLQNGIFDATNELWQGNDGVAGFLRMKEYELGVHKIGLSIVPPNASNTLNPIYSSFKVSRLPLTYTTDSQFTLLNAHHSAPVSQWVASLQTEMQKDHEYSQNIYTQKQLSTPMNNVFCPLLRIAFYARNKEAPETFRPILPNPQRSKYMFARLNKNRMAHPTMKQDNSGKHFGKYMTVNGVCFCPLFQGAIQQACLRAISSSDTCSLDKTIDSLKAIDNTWFLSHVDFVKDSVGNSKQCTVPLDWPVISSKLRDDMTDTSYDSIWQQSTDPINKQCHMLDRLQPFMYKYKNTKKVIPTTKNTISDGVCKTGRLSSTDSFYPVANARCVKTQMTDNTTTHTCDSNAGKYVLNRPTVKPVASMYRKYRFVKRNKCSQCAAPPVFMNNARTHTIANESSFGKAYRLSTSRMLAKDLRSVFQAKGIEFILNETAWNSSDFLHTYLKMPQWLVKSHYIIDTSSLSSRNVSAWKIDDSYKWKTPWVYCPTVDSFKNKTCLGFIERHQWIKHKTTMCPRIIKYHMQDLQQDPMSHASFANIDQYTNKVAAAIQQAREIIITANCIAAGNTYCMPRPFVYHPASYDSTNKAWVHDTVQQYYTRVNKTACPVTSKSLGYIQYLVDKQINCPANNVFLIESLLKTLRVAIAKVALLIVYFVSLLIKLVASIFSYGAKAELRKEWAGFKNAFSDLFSTTSDMLINGLMNSGVLGQSLMYFITTVCNGFNDALIWFADVYCQYITVYFLSALQMIFKFGGFMEGFVKAVQEFLSFLLRYYLPVSFLQRYVTTALQAYMIDKYDQPTDKSKRAIDQKKAVAATPKSKLARIKLAGANTYRTVSNVLSSVPVKSALTTIGIMAIFSITDMIVSAQEEALKNTIVDQLWVSNRGTFDFDFLKDALDNLTYFLTTDETCTNYMYARQHGYSTYLMHCPNFTFDPFDSTNPAKSIDATLCWATSNPSLGEASMYSCTASSTCCPASGCSSDKTLNVLCNECPLPVSAGVARYACNNMVCQCAVPVQVTSRCVAHSSCDQNGYCDLISMLSSVSYGTLRCADCPGKIMCIVSSSSSVSGSCACVMDTSVTPATCFDPPGTVVYPNPSHLCGYSRTITGSTTQTSFQYADLMAVLCSKSLRSICATVYMSSGYTVNMPIAYELRASVVGTGRRRHLLALNDWDFFDLENNDLYMNFTPPMLQASNVFLTESEYEELSDDRVDQIMLLPDWNISAAPCSILAHAFQQGHVLSILEKHEIKRCAYWRQKGKNIIKEFNLTSLQDRETFFVSFDDFAAALVQRNVIWDLLTHPWSIFKLFLMHPYFKPMRAIIVYIHGVMQNIIMSLPHTYNSSAVTLNVNQDVDDDLTVIVKQLHNAQRSFTYVNSTTTTNILYNSNSSKNIRQAIINTSLVKRRKRKQKPNTESREKHIRHLLTSQSEIEAVQQYSAAIISGQISPPLSLAASQSWLRNPFAWPPFYSYSINTCPIIYVTRDAFTEIFSVTHLYYQHFDDERPTPSSTLHNSVFVLFTKNYRDFVDATKKIDNKAGFSKAGSADNWINTFAKSSLTFFNLNIDDIQYFLFASGQNSLIWYVTKFFSCDYSEVMACGSNVKDLYITTVWFVIYFVIISFICNAIGFPSLSYAFILSYPAFVLYYAYNTPPICLPMVPPCLLDDILATLQKLIPITITMPAGLYCTSETKTGIFVSNTICLRQCYELGFVYWFDSLTYYTCAIDGQLCSYIVGLFPSQYMSNTTMDIWSPVIHSMQGWNTTVNTAPTLSAYTFCAATETVKILPFLFLVLALFTIIIAIVYACISLIPHIINVLTKIIMFNHTR